MSDVALLDVAAGHLGHLDFVCVANNFSAPVRELANVARSSLKAASGAPGFMSMPSLPSLRN